MALRGILAWLCLLAVLPCSHQTKNCSSQFLEDLMADLQMAVECSAKSVWTPQQTATLLLNVRNLTKTLRDFQGDQLIKCPQPKVPKNGGLACARVANSRFCKPLCNHGYDFAFLRRSRVFEECGPATGYKWSTQYIGGNKLAICNEAALQVAGAKTAYFAKDEDCLTTKENEQRKNDTLKVVAEELKKHDGIDGDVELLSLLCE
ncbi:uncharacterized protein LOC127610308 [Hippocampus zosterae]|uniref:uncharacterized protein LOC127610308 n=1 Tax=Hippocampus zosterae TaxID=109293 RepID=UPI00223DBA5B|nr:uncharacterized protein LOC127610308 [Hippocampus zosterae]